jgi:hypothetical protein
MKKQIERDSDDRYWRDEYGTRYVSYEDADNLMGILIARALVFGAALLCATQLGGCWINGYWKSKGGSRSSVASDSC